MVSRALSATSATAPPGEFVGTAKSRPDQVVQPRVEAFVVMQYRAGRSLREIAELTDRSFSAVRNILRRHGIARRGVVQGFFRVGDRPVRLPSTTDSA